MPTVAALMDDLLFLSRIREAARATRVEVAAVRAAGPLLAAARAGAALVLVDADSGRVPWAEAVAALRADPDPAVGSLPVVAFVSHVNAERASAARTAGATRVLARGAFVQELPDLLAAVASPPGSGQEKSS